MTRRLFALALLAGSTCLAPALAIRAQQPPPAPQDQPKQDSAKDVIRDVRKAEEAAAGKAEDEAIEKIKDEGLNRSQVMDTISYLTDVIGPRLTGTPGLKRANEWTRDKMSEWGLENAKLEAWGPFGRGWTLRRFSAQVIEPQCIPLIAYPSAWSPGTDGPVSAEVVYFDAKDDSELDRFKGQLRGKAVLSAPLSEVEARFDPLATRLTEEQLLALANAGDPNERRPQPPARGEAAKGQGRPSGPSSDARAAMEFQRKKRSFLFEEGPAVLLEPSFRGDGGTIFVSSASVPSPAPSESSDQESRRVSAYDKDAPKTVPQLVLAKEHYNRLVRMIRQGESLKVEVDLSVTFHEDDDLMAFNTVAEIPGTDLADEVVMLGGHLDSWHSGTGATDNASGVGVAMEAARIIKAAGLKPRRTIRVALWTGEEQGLFGSRAYVQQHFGQFGDGSPADRSRAARGDRSVALNTKPDYDKFSAYYNLDNGTGKIRGIYMQGNEALRPIFRRWLAPFGDMGASTVSLANTGGTDHQSFDAIGLPGFQFIQDRIEYGSRTHHSNMDVYDRVQADDMKQASVIMAAFVYNTAMMDEQLPRKPKPGSRD